MKAKKFWILNSGNEKVEEVEGSYNNNDMGNVSSDIYCDNNNRDSGWYILMPFDGQVSSYRKFLIMQLITKQEKIVEIANKRILQLNLMHEL